jgi:hypothetical protein
MEREKVERRENDLKREFASTQGQFPGVNPIYTRDQYIVPMILRKMSVANAPIAPVTDVAALSWRVNIRGQGACITFVPGTPVRCEAAVAVRREVVIGGESAERETVYSVLRRFRT